MIIPVLLWLAWGVSLYFLFGTLKVLGAQTGISGWVLDEGHEIYCLI